VPAHERVPQPAAGEPQAVADRGAGRVAGRAIVSQGRAGLEEQRLDLLAPASDRACDVVMGDVAELRQDERRALVVRQLRDVVQRRAQVLAPPDHDVQVVARRLRKLVDGTLAAAAQHGHAAVARDGVEPCRRAIDRSERLRSR
jgi:hypothetical protein